MRPEHSLALRDAVVAALEAGIDGGGASIDDYRDGRGEKGTMQERFLVHTREGEPCSGEDCGGRRRADRRLRPLHLLLPELPGAAATAAPTAVTAQTSDTQLTGSTIRPVRPASILMAGLRSRRRQWSCAAFATERQTASCTSTRRRGGGSGRSPRARARPKSRFGGRLEPFFRLDLILHEGPRRAAHRHQRRHRRRLPAPALLRAGARAPAPAPATRCCGCSTRPSPTSPPTTCSAATSRCSTNPASRAPIRP